MAAVRWYITENWLDRLWKKCAFLFLNIENFLGKNLILWLKIKKEEIFIYYKLKSESCVW